MQRFGMAILLTFAIATGLQAKVEQPSISSSLPSIDLTTPNCESSQDAYICVFVVTTPDGTLLRAHIVAAEKPLIRAFLRDIQYGHSLYNGYFAMKMAMDAMGTITMYPPSTSPPNLPSSGSGVEWVSSGGPNPASGSLRLRPWFSEPCCCTTPINGAIVNLNLTLGYTTSSVGPISWNTGFNAPVTITQQHACVRSVSWFFWLCQAGPWGWGTVPGSENGPFIFSPRGGTYMFKLYVVVEVCNYDTPQRRLYKWGGASLSTNPYQWNNVNFNSPVLIDTENATADVGDYYETA